MAAALLLGSRLKDAYVVRRFADVRKPLDDARWVLALVPALRLLVPGLEVDEARVEGDLDEWGATVRRIRDEAAKALGRLRRPEAPSSRAYG